MRTRRGRGVVERPEWIRANPRPPSNSTLQTDVFQRANVQYSAARLVTRPRALELCAIRASERRSVLEKQCHSPESQCHWPSSFFLPTAKHIRQQLARTFAWRRSQAPPEPPPPTSKPDTQRHTVTNAHRHAIHPLAGACNPPACPPLPRTLPPGVIAVVSVYLSAAYTLLRSNSSALSEPTARTAKSCTVERGEKVSDSTPGNTRSPAGETPY